MTALTGRTPASTYKDLLQVSNNNSGIDTTPRPVEDGEGTQSPLQISTTKVNIQSGLQLGGVDVAITAEQLNTLASIGGTTTTDALRVTGGLTSVLKTLRDGNNNDAAFQVSTTAARFVGDWFVGSTRITATANQINSLNTLIGATVGSLRMGAAVAGTFQAVTDTAGSLTGLSLSNSGVRINSLNLNGTTLSATAAHLNGVGAGMLRIGSALSSTPQNLTDNSGNNLPVQATTDRITFTSQVDLGSGTVIRGNTQLVATFSELNAIAGGESAPNVIWVTKSGNDASDGSSVIKAKLTVKSAVARAIALQDAFLAANVPPSATIADRARARPRIVIKVAAGDYSEVCPIVLNNNISIVGDGLRVVSIRPTPETNQNDMFLVDGGCYITGVTFRGHQFPSFAIAFKPGAYILASPYVQNCSSITAKHTDGQAGSIALNSDPTGGGMKVDGAVPNSSSPIKSMVCDSFTQVNLNGPGFLILNDGYAQLVSCFGTFCSYHVKAETGGQVNLSNSTTDFGSQGLVATGKSVSAIYTGAYSSDRTGLANNQIRVGSLGTNRPYGGMIMEINIGGVDVLFTVGVATAPIGGQSTVTVSPALTVFPANGAPVKFYNRSVISTGSHTMEFVGAGFDYGALPQNGGVPVPNSEAVDDGIGRVYYTSTDHLGNFKVGAFLRIDQATGSITIPADANINLSSLSALGPFRQVIAGTSSPVGVAVAEFSDTVGSGLLVSNHGNLAATLPTSRAVMEYVDSKVGAVIDITATNNVANTGWTFTIDGRAYANDPVLRLYKGFEYRITVQPTSSSAAYAFFIKTDSSSGATNSYNDGVTNNGAYTGAAGGNVITFKVPYDAPAKLYYTASGFPAMTGEIQLFDLVDYSSLSGRPTIVSAFVNDAGYLTAGSLSGVAVTSVAGRSGAVTLTAADVGGLASVATTGSYSSLTGTPTIGVAANNIIALDGSARLPSVPILQPELREVRLREQTLAATGTLTLNYATADRFRVTATGNISTINITNMPIGRAASIVLEAVNWGSFAITHPASMRFAGGLSPSYTASGSDVIIVEKNSNEEFTWMVASKNVRAVS